MLLGNYSILLRNTDRILGIAFSVPLYTFTPDCFYNVATMPAETSGVVDKIAWPDGYSPPTCFFIPLKSGATASKGEAAGTTSATATVAGGKYAQASATGQTALTVLASMLLHAQGTAAGATTAISSIAGTIDAIGSASGQSTTSAAFYAAVNAAASVLGSTSASAEATGGASVSASALSETIASAALSSALNAAASVVGSTSATAAIVGLLGAAAAVACSSQADAEVSGIGSLAGSASGGTAAAFETGAIPAFVSGSNVDASTLTPASVAAAVWDSLVANFQASGTFGEAISQGSAGLTQQQIRDAMALASSETPASGSIEKLLIELHRIMGLDPTKPLVVTSTTRTAGAEIEQSISEAPTGTVTVTRQ